MREILFRAKTETDNDDYKKGEWVEGCVFQVFDDGFFITDGKCHSVKVDPETIGQYTSLTDKNGTKIFEGDILSERPPMNQTAYIGYVAYDEELAVWRYMIKNDKGYNGVLLGSYSKSYTVIGNIHDNPELLKGGKE